MSDSLKTCLDRLEQSEIVRRLHDSDLAYWIRHTLVQETVTASLLNQERKRLHRLVAESLEALYPEQLDENIALLAQHFVAAGEDAKAYAYCLRAGEAAFKVYALDEALEFFTLAIAAGKRAGVSVQEAYLKRGRGLELGGRFQHAVENYREMYVWGEQKHDRAMQLAALSAQATVHAIPTDVYNPALTRELSDRALVLARELNDAPSEAKIFWNLMLVGTRVDTDYTQGIKNGERALEIAQAHNLREQEALVLKDIAPLYAFVGEPTRAKQSNRQADTLWREIGNQAMIADNLGYAIMIQMQLGEYSDVGKTMDQALVITRAIGNQWGEAFAQTWSGVAFKELGDITRAVQVMNDAIALGGPVFAAPLIFTRGDLARLYGEFGQVARGIPLAEQSLATVMARFPNMSNLSAGTLAHLHLLHGDVAAASTLLEHEPTEVQHLGNPRFGTFLLVAQVELAVAAGELERANAIAEGLYAHLERVQHLAFIPITLLYWSRALAAQGQLEQAIERLRHAQAVAAQLNSRWMLWQVLADLSQLETRRGNADNANTYVQQARELIEYIAAHTPPDLCESFLASPAVQSLMRHS